MVSKKMDKQIKQKYSTNTIRLHRSMPIFMFEMNLLLLAGDQINSFLEIAATNSGTAGKS